MIVACPFKPEHNLPVQLNNIGYIKPSQTVHMYTIEFTGAGVSWEYANRKDRDKVLGYLMLNKNPYEIIRKANMVVG